LELIAIPLRNIGVAYAGDSLKKVNDSWS